jgi:hypothetical protein
MWAENRADCRPGPFRLQAVTLNPSFVASRWISALTMGLSQTVSCTVRCLATKVFCERGVLVVNAFARMGIYGRAGWAERMRARVVARLSCHRFPCAFLFFVGFSWF